jgi:hypothetical protein
MGLGDFIRDNTSTILTGAVSPFTGAAAVGASNDAARRQNTRNIDDFYNQLQSAIDRGIQEGSETATTRFGATDEETGQGLKQVLSERKKQLDEKSVESEALKRYGTSQVGASRARAQASGRTPTAGEEAEIKRKGDFDAARLAQQKKYADIGAYQSVLTNLARNKGALEMGYASLRAGALRPPEREPGGAEGLINRIGSLIG